MVAQWPLLRRPRAYQSRDPSDPYSGDVGIAIANVRALIALRALLRDEPRVPATAWPDRFDIVQWALSRSAQGGVLIPRADPPASRPMAA